MSKTETATTVAENKRGAETVKVALENIQIETGFNVRGLETPEEKAKIADLALSISLIGLSEPLKGYKIPGTEQFMLGKGHRRVAATHLANELYGGQLNTETGEYELITHLPMYKGSSDTKVRVLEMLLDGDSSQSLTNEQMVVGIHRLLELGMSTKEIKDTLAINVSQAQVYNLIKAAGAPEPIQEMLADGVISVAAVNDLQRQTKNAENPDEALVERATEVVAEAKTRGKKATTGSVKTDKVSKDVQRLQAAYDLVENKESEKAALVKTLINLLKKGSTPEEIAKRLK